MVRLKFLLFALLVLGLGLAHLPLLSGPLGARAVQAATEQTASGVNEVSRALEARRALARDAALKLAASPRLRATLEALVSERGLEPLTAERFAPIRKAAEASLPPELAGSVVAVLAGTDTQHGRVGGESTTDAALDVQALARAEGVQVADAFGVPHVFASVPVLWDVTGLEPVVTATLVVGVPLVKEGVLDAAVAASGTSALLLVKGEALLGSAGPEKALAEGALKKLTAGQSGVVLRRGELSLLGPVKLPVLTQNDALGGQAPLTVGSRRAVEGTPYEVVALAATKPALALLAEYQTNALFGLAGLLGFSLVWTLLMGSGGKREKAEARGGDTLNLGAAMASQPAPAAQAQPQAHAAHAAQPEPAPAPEDAFAFPPPPPVATGTLEPEAAQPADDFPFAPPPPTPAAPAEEAFPFPPPPAADGFPFASPETTAPYPVAAGMPLPPPASGAMPFDPEPPAFVTGAAPPIATAGPRAGAYAFEDQPTAAYSMQQAADPFALASAQGALEHDNPETTRVAAIPRELLQAAARPPQTEEAIPLPPRNPAPPAPAPQAMAAARVMQSMPAPAAVPLPGVGNAVALTEEQHFQDVFREFVTTRERCGEPADGLTYDKFVAKLRKNREQLMQKYACKTVRFQVYVKEGKAALKATPVKD